MRTSRCEISYQNVIHPAHTQATLCAELERVVRARLLFKPVHRTVFVLRFVETGVKPGRARDAQDDSQNRQQYQAKQREEWMV